MPNPLPLNPTVPPGRERIIGRALKRTSECPVWHQEFPHVAFDLLKKGQEPS